MSEENKPNIECNVFLALPTEEGDLKVHFKILGQGSETIDEFERLIGEKLQAGYKPDRNGAGKAAPAPASPAGPGERKTKYEIDGAVFWVNPSKFQKDKFFVRRVRDGKGDIVKGDEIPAEIRAAYGSAID